MPIYEYECEDGHRTQETRPIDRRAEPRQCTWPLHFEVPGEVWVPCNKEAKLVPSSFSGQVSGGTPKFYPGRS